MSGNNTCLSCNEAVDPKEAFMSCVECTQSYHIGNCAGLTEKQFKNRSASSKQKWTCPSCKAAKQKDENQSDRVTREEFAGLRSLLISMNEKLDGLVPLKETVSNIEKSIEVMSDKYDELLKRLAVQESDTKNVKARVEKLEQKARCSETKTEKLVTEINELEWRSRQLNLEFHGIQVTPNEDLLMKVNSVAGLLEVPELSKLDVDAIHRLPAKAGKVPGIIVRYARQATRDKWLENRRKLRNNESSTFILENMTTRCRQLFLTAKFWQRKRATNMYGSEMARFICVRQTVILLSLCAVNVTFRHDLSEQSILIILLLLIFYV